MMRTDVSRTGPSPDARDRSSSRTCCRRRGRSASSSTTTRCTPSSTCRSKRRSSAPPNSWARAVPGRVAVSREAGVGPHSRQRRRGAARSNNWAPAARAMSPASDPGSISGGPSCCTAFLPRPAGSSRGFSKKRRRCRGSAPTCRRTPGPRWRAARAGRSRRRGAAGGAAPVERVPRGGRPRRRVAGASARHLRFAIATGCWPCTASTPMPGSIRR